MLHDVEFSALLLYAIFFSSKANYDPFSDNTHFTVNFAGPPKANDEFDVDLSKETLSSQMDDNSVVLSTQDNERYRCIIPTVISAQTIKEDSYAAYHGPNEKVLLSPLFDQSSCSYKIEPYWTYELCHGKYIRQYHEEKEVGKDITVQEFYLGKQPVSADTGHAESTEAGDDTEQMRNKQVPVKQIGGSDYPYYEVVLEGGTHCELTAYPRKTAVHYVCHELGRGEIYEFKETSTCEYEITVLTQVLCSHPLYQQQKDPVNKINCHSLDGSPRRPKNLVNYELENTQGRFANKDDENENVDWEYLYEYFGMTRETLEEWLEEQLYPKVQVQRPPDTTPSTPSTPEKKSTTQKPGMNASDKQLLRDFLNGDYCIQGGTGWWKHEFCYGKSVTQFHEDRESKTVIVLGVWDEEKHVDWIESNPKKTPQHLSPNNQIVHHYYGGGEYCELTGKPRAVEVKLRCKENLSQPHSVSIYLVEPKSCEYNLVVESPILCSILSKADEDGLIFIPET